MGAAVAEFFLSLWAGIKALRRRRAAEDLVAGQVEVDRVKADAAEIDRLAVGTVKS